MKYARVLGLLAVAAAALMAFAATASADILTSPTGSQYKNGNKIAGAAEGHATLHNPIATIECASNVAGTVTSQEAGKKVIGNIETLTFTSCTKEWHVTAAVNGTLRVENNNNPNRAYDGDVYSDGATVEATRFGVTCRYKTSTTTVGTLTAGSTATMHIQADIPFHNGSFLCGSEPTKWTGSYIVNTPDSLFVDNS
jgi:hypothetical protein